MRVITMALPQSSIEDVLCSRVRLKILKVLMQSDELNVSEIARKIGVNYASTKMHLEALEKEGVLTHVMFGKRIRYYRFQESARARAVKAFIEAWHAP